MTRTFTPHHYLHQRYVFTDLINGIFAIIICKTVYGCQECQKLNIWPFVYNSLNTKRSRIYGQSQHSISPIYILSTHTNSESANSIPLLSLPAHWNARLYWTLGTTEIQTAAIKEVEVLWLEWDLDSVKLIVYNLNMDHAHSVIFIYDPGPHILQQGTTCKNVTFSNWQNYGNDGKCSKKVLNDSIVGPIFVTGHAPGLTWLLSARCPVIPGSHDTRTLCGH